MRHIGDAIFVLFLLALGAFCNRCTIKVEAPPWPDGGLVEVPPIQVPCVENPEAGWTCRWPDGGR